MPWIKSTIEELKVLSSFFCLTLVCYRGSANLWHHRWAIFRESEDMGGWIKMILASGDPYLDSWKQMWSEADYSSFNWWGIKVRFWYFGYNYIWVGMRIVLIRNFSWQVQRLGRECSTCLWILLKVITCLWSTYNIRDIGYQKETIVG